MQGHAARDHGAAKMTDFADQASPLPRTIWRWLPMMAAAANAFAAVAVIYWIYRARVLYGLSHPEIVAVSPATIITS